MKESFNPPGLDSFQQSSAVLLLGTGEQREEALLEERTGYLEPGNEFTEFPRNRSKSLILVVPDSNWPSIPG